MNDRNQIMAGLVIFVIIATFPFWYNLGAASSTPDPLLTDKAKAAKTCVRDTAFMKSEHMQLLNLWRETVVRTGDRVYNSPNGHSYNMSLSTGENSCMGCHSNKADFCDRCHNYASVAPYCWDCHIEPKETK